jgi:hypothetical protein
MPLTSTRRISHSLDTLAGAVPLDVDLDVDVALSVLASTIGVR